METKEEIKKAILTEPIKFALQAILVFLMTLIPGVVPYVRQILLPSIPVWLLLLGNLVFFSLAVSFFLLWRRTRKELLDAPEIIALPPFVPIEMPEPIAPKIFEPDRIERRMLNYLFQYPQPKTALQNDGNLGLEIRERGATTPYSTQSKQLRTC